MTNILELLHQTRTALEAAKLEVDSLDEKRRIHHLWYVEQLAVACREYKKAAKAGLL